MDNQEIQNEEIEINLAELFQVLKEHLHIIIISTLICAILVGAFTIFFVKKHVQKGKYLRVTPFGMLHDSLPHCARLGRD